MAASGAGFNAWLALLWRAVLRWVLLALPCVLLLALHDAARPPPCACGSRAGPAAAVGARWRRPQARHAVLFTGRASDFDLVRIDTVVAALGGAAAVDAYGVLGYAQGEGAAAAAQAALAAFAAHPAAVAAELFLQPAGALPPEAAAAMPSWSYGTVDVPAFSPRDTAMIHTSLLRAWRLLECGERARRRRYGMVARSRSDLRVLGRAAGGAFAVDLDAFAAGAHALEVRLDGVHALEGVPHSDNLLHTSLARGGGGGGAPQQSAPAASPAAHAALPLYLPAKWGYGAYNVQLGWGPRDTMQLYFSTLLAVESVCAGLNVTYAEETALMGGLVVRAEARGALVAVHWVDVEYCLSSPFNPCPEGL
jgi:hypothetical protein